MNNTRITYSLCLVTLLFLSLLSCKKDLLHYRAVQALESNTSVRLNSIYFLNDSIGFVAGGDRFYSSILLTTHDAGYTWAVDSFPEAGKELFDIRKAPNGNIYTCGFDGKLLYSQDGGQQWSFKQLRYNPYKKVVFADDNNGLVIGGISFLAGYMAHINAQGDMVRWDSLDYELNDIVMLNQRKGFICGYGAVQRTDDGGNTWHFLDLKGDNFTAISTIGNDMWLCGYNGSILHSPDMGTSWEKQRNGNDVTQATYHLAAMLFTDNMHGWAVGEQGTIIYSDDGGRHWSAYDKFTSEDLRCIASAPNGDILVAGDNGTLFRLKP
jgi:photosystem II stability/assembly factor-like uncharacterized protein